MRRTFIRRATFGFLLLGSLLMLAGPSSAGPIYGCTAGSDCNGNTYALSVISHVGNTYKLELDIDVLNTYTGNHWTDVVEAVGIKDFVPSFSAFSLVSAPGGLSNWILSQLELSANGCATGSGVDKLCAVATDAPYVGAPVSGAGTILTWVFQFDAIGPLNATSHIKYEYEDADGKKIGSLGSWDIGIQNTSPAPGNTVPEPMTLALFGAAFAGMSWARGRRLR